MTQMRLAVYVIYGSRDVKTFTHPGEVWPTLRRLATKRKNPGPPIRRSSSLQEKREQPNAESDPPNQAHGLGLRQAAAHQSMRQMISVPHIKRSSRSPPQMNDPGQVRQRDCQHEKRSQYGKRLVVFH